jgi:hypothetical protein
LVVNQRILRPDLVAAVAAVVVAVVAYAAGADPILAIVAALVAYAVVALVRTRPAGDGRESPEETEERTELAYETSRQKVAALRGLATQIGRDGTREVVVRICDQSEQVLAIMSAGKAKSAAPLYLEQLLEPAEALVETYVHLASRGLRATDEAQARSESQDLPKIERASRLFLERLRQDPEVDLAALSQILTFNLETTSPIVEPPRR